MPSLTSLFSIILTGVILVAGLFFLSTARLEYCGWVEHFHPGSRFPRIADARKPTLAPPRHAIVIRIEADRPDLEVGWLNF